MMRQLPHTDVKYCMAFSFVEDISFWTFASHQSDCHWLLGAKKVQDFPSLTYSLFTKTILLLTRKYSYLEIKPCRLGSGIQDTEAEWRLKVITDLISLIW